MKKLVLLLMLFALAACNRTSIFETYELSYSRSGGYAPIYENLLIENFTAYYFFEGQGQKYNKKVSISSEEKQALLHSIESNDLSSIREDYKKLFDHITTTIKVKTTKQKTFKDNGSAIVPEHQARWANMVQSFESFIQSKNLRNP